MKIALNGASGYTGRLAAAELARRGIDAVLVGRDSERLRAASARTGFEVRIADIRDQDTLEVAFRGVDAVVNAAGPFARLGSPVVRAAIAAEAHYVDTAGEQQYIKNVFDTFADAATHAGVTVVPAMADDGGAGDFISHLLGEATGAADVMTVAVWYRGGILSRGTLRSLDPDLLFGGALRYENGGWTSYGEASHLSWRFPDEQEVVEVSKAALPPVATVPRHVSVERMEGLLGGSFDRLKSGIDAAVIDSLPEGPDDEQRRQARWTISVEAATAGGRTARGEVEGTDGYGKTAVIAVEAARRLVADGAKAGVLAPSQAFDPESFLGFLSGHGVRWQITQG
ncbi:saccharopine dehydrogenase NADP-binding domain-containing protein [Frankia sp. Mgl5]|uniref:saccharopine dehydrogenase family protein n=1 Tax=Frankia sp. Mgl5 TaxID=2933793 RepID=UPI00200E2D28|nr:saccharopine dehydrogenase NADP-binding domain-containing protein [Frankia sp. Mgl5]MCK9926586.1 saccharopine dehydrogenase NADP-binding domain-containing protein [Frankia sp. Mgl5]